VSSIPIHAHADSRMKIANCQPYQDAQLPQTPRYPSEDEQVMHRAPDPVDFGALLVGHAGSTTGSASRWMYETGLLG
jgi:hypothetical protein